MARISIGLAAVTAVDEDAEASLEAMGLVTMEDGEENFDGTHNIEFSSRRGLQEAQTFELGSGDSTEFFSTRGVKTLIAVTDGNAKWEVQSQDGSFNDFHVMSAAAQTATTNAGVVTEGAMPPNIRLTDTSSAANTVTIYATFL
jgi:hypothetical protein